MNIFNRLKGAFTQTTNNAQVIIRPTEYSTATAVPTTYGGAYTGPSQVAPSRDNTIVGQGYGATTSQPPYNMAPNISLPSIPMVNTGNISLGYQNNSMPGVQVTQNFGGERRIDEDKIRKDLAEMETRMFPSPYPVTISIPDSYPTDLMMQPLNMDFNSRELIMTALKKRSKEDQAKANAQLRKEKDYFENTIPNIQRKLNKLQKEVSEQKQAQNFIASGDYQNLIGQLQETDQQINANMQEIIDARRQLLEMDPATYQSLYGNEPPEAVGLPSDPYQAPRMTGPPSTHTGPNRQYPQSVYSAPQTSANYQVPVPEVDNESLQANQMAQYPPPPPGYPPYPMPAYPGYPPNYPPPPPGYYPPPPQPPSQPTRARGPSNNPKKPNPNNPLLQVPKF